MIRAAFFDIDGTLKPFDEIELRESMIETLHELQKKGIRVFIATGRPPVQLHLLGKRMNEFPWDGYVMLNGQYCMDQNRKCFHEMPIPQEALEHLIPWIKETADYPCSFLELDYSYDIAFNQSTYDYLKSLGREKEMPPVEDPVRALTHKTFQICPYIPVEKDAEWVSHAPGMKSARWTPAFADMIPEKGGKPVGIQKTLEHYGLKREESIAFGDGGNDITMLEYAGTGVAMGNAADDVKKHADYVTDDCWHEGIQKALRHFDILS